MLCSVTAGYPDLPGNVDWPCWPPRDGGSPLAARCCHAPGSRASGPAAATGLAHACAPCSRPHTGQSPEGLFSAPPEQAEGLLLPLCPQALAAHPVSVELASRVTVTGSHILFLHCPCGSSPLGPASCVFAPALARKQCLEIAADGRDFTCVARGGRGGPQQF